MRPSKTKVKGLVASLVRSSWSKSWLGQECTIVPLSRVQSQIEYCCIFRQIKRRRSGNGCINPAAESIEGLYRDVAAGSIKGRVLGKYRSNPTRRKGLQGRKGAKNKGSRCKLKVCLRMIRAQDSTIASAHHALTFCPVIFRSRPGS